MPNIQINKELRSLENSLIKRYSMISKILFLSTIIFVLLVVVISAGVYALGFSYNWAGLTLNNWLLVLSVILCFFILINVFLYYHFKNVNIQRVEAEKPKPEFVGGKKVHVYTHPKESEGGIFSKTYIELDEHNILRLRLLMVKPTDLWSKSKEE